MKIRRRALGASVAGALVVMPLFAASCAQATDSTEGGDGADAGGGATTPTSSDAASAPDRRAPSVDSGSDARVDSGRDSGVDGARDAAVEAAVDAGVDAPFDTGVDAGVDAAVDAGVDAGPVCAAPCGAQAVCVAGACIPARRVFVSSTSSTAALGGAAGADATCQSLATAASLGGTWMAWLSESSTNTPSARMTHATVEYRLIDGSIVAASWTGLASNALLRGIDLDENGNPGFGSEVWTGTTYSGVASGAGCSGFTSGLHTATTTNVGISGRTDGTWSAVYQQFCDRTIKLYCIEQ